MLLLDMPERYAEALKPTAPGDEWQTLRIDGEWASSANDDSPALAVIYSPSPPSSPSSPHSRQDTRRLLERVRALRRRAPLTPCVVIGHAVESTLALALGQLGVVELIALPASEQELRERCMARAAPRPGTTSRVAAEPSAAMRDLRRSVQAASRCNSTVLLTGETGTGKTTLAKEIHESSTRSSAPFVHLNCAVLAPSLIESELFGHERGAFTGAVSPRVGRIEAAGSGTLLLDEIGEMELSLQAKLLRVLEEREFERVGGAQTIRVKARVVAATNKNLRQALLQGEFRSDLFFRLGAFHIEVPALRDRREDLPGLIEAQVRILCERNGLRRPAMACDFLKRMLAYSWPGNIRELMNVLERVVLPACPAVLRASQLDGLPLIGNSLDAPLTSPTPTSEISDELSAVLIATGGNVARAARRLRVPRTTLRYRIAQRGLGRHIPSD